MNFMLERKVRRVTTNEAQCYGVTVSLSLDGFACDPAFISSLTI